MPALLINRRPPFIIAMICILFAACSSEPKQGDGTASNGEGQAMFPYFERSSAPFRKFKTRAGYMDMQGNKVLDAEYIFAETFTEGLGCVAVLEGTDVRYGYIDPSGEFVIKPQYKGARPFSEGRAWVHDGEHDWYAIDPAGKPITEAAYNIRTTDYHNGHCIAYVWKRREEKRGFLGMKIATSYYDCYRIDREGNRTLIAEESSRTDYSDTINTALMNHIGVFWMTDSTGKGSYGYKKINVSDYENAVFSECGNYAQKGRPHIEAKFRYARCFYQGYARVKLKSRESAYIDTSGTVLFTFEDDR